MLERFSKSYRIINKEKKVEKLINFSVDQDYFILLNSNNNSINTIYYVHMALNLL